MTTFGKLLVFLNLVVAVGIAIGSTVVYTQRPTWFDPAPDAVEKGNTVLTFAGLKSEIDTLTRSAAAQSRAYGTAYVGIVSREQTRDRRRDVLFGPVAKDGKRTGGWLEVARRGDPARKDSAGFFEIRRVPSNARRLDAGLIDTTQKDRGAPVVGPGGDPLRASETLLERYNTDVKAVTDLLASIEKLREQQVKLGHDISWAETRILKQIEIRDNQQTALFYLSGFEINWFSQLETVRRRKMQLDGRLETLKTGK
jgi:hypothetical protein